MISLTTSVPAGLSRSTHTQSQARGPLLLKTTVLVKDVPKCTDPNDKRDNGAPCKIVLSITMVMLGTTSLKLNNVNKVNSNEPWGQITRGTGPPPRLGQSEEQGDSVV